MSAASGSKAKKIQSFLFYRRFSFNYPLNVTVEMQTGTMLDEQEVVLGGLHFLNNADKKYIT